MHRVLVDDPEATGAALDPVRLPDLHDLPDLSDLPDLADLLLAPPGSAGPADNGSTPPHGPTDEGRHRAGSSTRPDLEITRTRTIWLWLWGPLLAAVIVVSFLSGMTSAPVAVPLPTSARPATVLDVQNRPLATVEPPAGAEPVPAEQLPDLLLQAIVAVEDPGYFSRNGLSATDLVRAGAADLVRVRRHGSTIDERYARQVRVAAGSRLPSLRESTVAARLSQRLSRRALLVRYVNGLYFGNGIYGVGAAARFYFGSPITSLDAAQIALLAGIADDPARSNPVTAPAFAVAAQQAAIGAMRNAGLLTAPQADAALREPIDARAHRQLERPSAAPDFTALVESSLLSRYGDDAVYGQDLRVVTPLDLDLQAALSDTVRRLVPTNVPAVLALATDPRTGDIRAMLNRSASSSATGPEGASDVLFNSRPLGTLATGLPVPIGNGGSASVGEVAATAGALTTDGVRHDLRPLTSVTRPALLDQPAATLDRADPVPPGRPLVDPEQARLLTANLRSSARAGGSSAARLPFALTALSSVRPGQPSTGPTWYVGCLPELCLTVWTGDTSGPDGVAAPQADAGLAGSIVVSALEQYAALAPGRVALPPLPQPLVVEHRSLPHPGMRTTQPAPTSVVVRVRPNTRATVRPPQGPPPSAAPTVAATPSASPSPATGGSATDGGSSGAAPTAHPGPPKTRAHVGA